MTWSETSASGAATGTRKRPSQANSAKFPLGPESGESRVMRGGSYMDLNAFFRSSHRDNMALTMVVGNLRFRVVEVLEKGDSEGD